MRNKAYYAEYKKKMHTYSRRGTKKDPAQKEVRKQFSDKKKTMKKEKKEEEERKLLLAKEEFPDL